VSWRFATRFTQSLSKETDLNFSGSRSGWGTPVDQQKTLSGNRLSGEFDNAWIETLIAHMTWHY
jgi:long-chain fatty acid transport protein